MSRGDDDHLPGLTPERDTAISALLSLCARWLVADADVPRFLDRLADTGPAIFPELFDDGGANTAAAASFFRSFGWAIASAMPLPQHDFRPQKLPQPGRNDPCLCGSLRKFKHCCAPMLAQLPRFEPDGLAPMVIDAMPRAQWKTLPQSKVTPHLVLVAAVWMHGEGKTQDACKLLEPWAQLPAPWPDGRVDLLDLLGDVYLDLRKPIKRKQLAQLMVERGERQVQSLGWMRLAMMASDKGDARAAQAAFERAQRLTPDDPRLAVLEVTLHWGAGQLDRARERAQFHARRLSRLPHADQLADSIVVLEALARGEWPGAPGMGDDGDDDDDDGDAIDWDIDPHGPFAELQRWVKSLPPPKLRLDLADATADDLGALQPSAIAAKALKRWRAAFKYEAPLMAWERAGEEALQVFERETWSALLRREPILIDCFEVLDGLLLVLDVVPVMLTAHLQSLLLDRALQLWALLRAAYPAARCEWAHLANRPALRVLSHRISIDATPRADGSFEWLQHLVAVLNPHDNHGHRARLAAVYLRRGQVAQALALCERYPGDRVDLALLHARALLGNGLAAQAQAQLAAAAKANAHAVPLLTGGRKPREPGVDRYTVGSPEEARIAVHDQWDLWRDDKAVRAWVVQQAARVAGAPATGSLFDDPPAGESA